MNEKSGAKPSGKILFGVDYLFLMRYMELVEDEEQLNNRRKVTDGIIQFFLLQWGFSATEINDANNLFFEKVSNNDLDRNIDIVIDRIANFVKDDKEKQERFVIQMAAVGSMDGEISERERDIGSQIKDKFDLRQSEFTALISRGIDWSTCFDYIGQLYIEEELN